MAPPQCKTMASASMPLLFRIRTFSDMPRTLAGIFPHDAGFLSVPRHRCCRIWRQPSCNRGSDVGHQEVSVRRIEIPRKQWSGKLDQLGRRHDGWLVSLDITMPESIGAQAEFRQMPLVGITSERIGIGTISIAVEEPDGDHVTHMIHAPTHVFVETT